jgi:plasmid stabilization system protein ParE
MVEVIVASPAEQEYADSLSWYAERSMRAAEQFEIEFDRALNAIATEPDRFPRCDERHRYFLMRRYPFQVIYRRSGEQIVVIAVAHTSRKPGYWSSR